MKEKKKILILTGIFLVLAIAVFILSYQKAKVKLPSPKPAPLPTIVELPTLSPERREIISKMTSHKIVIANGAFSPTNLTIKVHDQVEWENKESNPCQITSNGRISPPIRPGKKFTRTFDEPGTFTYFSSLHPQVKGKIIVTE